MMNPGQRVYKGLLRAYRCVARRMAWLNALGARGLRPVRNRAARAVADMKRKAQCVRSQSFLLEALESRMMLSVTPALLGSNASFMGDGGANQLALRVTGGVLEFSDNHGASYSSDLDLASAGDQTLTVGPGTTISVNMRDGTHRVSLHDTLLDSPAGWTLELLDGGGTDELTTPGTHVNTWQLT